MHASAVCVMLVVHRRYLLHLGVPDHHEGQYMHQVRLGKDEMHPGFASNTECTGLSSSSCQGIPDIGPFWKLTPHAYSLRKGSKISRATNIGRSWETNGSQVGWAISATWASQ